METQEKVTYLPSATSLGPLLPESVAFYGGYQEEETLNQCGLKKCTVRQDGEPVHVDQLRAEEMMKRADVLQM